MLTVWSSTLLVYLIGQFQNVPLGNVYVKDVDDWDSANKSFSFASPGEAETSFRWSNVISFGFLHDLLTVCMSGICGQYCSILANFDSILLTLSLAKWNVRFLMLIDVKIGEFIKWNYERFISPVLILKGINWQYSLSIHTRDQTSPEVRQSGNQWNWLWMKCQLKDIRFEWGFASTLFVKRSNRQRKREFQCFILERKMLLPISVLVLGTFNQQILLSKNVLGDLTWIFQILSFSDGSRNCVLNNRFAH